MNRENRTAAAPRSRYWLGLCALSVALAAAAFLLSQHRGHVVGYWPYLLLLACPLMHLFMHRDHGKGDHH